LGEWPFDQSTNGSANMWGQSLMKTEIHMDNLQKPRILPYFF